MIINIMSHNINNSNNNYFFIIYSLYLFMVLLNGDKYQVWEMADWTHVKLGTICCSTYLIINIMI